jgi:hypothetical protein
MLIIQMMKEEGPWDLDRAWHSQQPQSPTMYSTKYITYNIEVKHPVVLPFQYNVN